MRSLNLVFTTNRNIFKWCELSAWNRTEHVFVDRRRLFSTKMAQKKETFMIAGLGNLDLPKTRHSVGMALVDRLAKFLGMTLVKKKECLGLVAEKDLGEINVVLLKPKQPMNVNGKSVSKTATYYGIPRSHIYLIHDDLERAVGKVAIKVKGSASGHNGVKSVIQSFRSDDIFRLRIGIDRPARIEEVGGYVLANFTRTEQDTIDQSIDVAIVKLAQHIGDRIGVLPVQVFSNARTVKGEIGLKKVEEKVIEKVDRPVDSG